MPFINCTDTALLGLSPSGRLSIDWSICSCLTKLSLDNHILIGRTIAGVTLIRLCATQSFFPHLKNARHSSDKTHLGAPERFGCTDFSA